MPNNPIGYVILESAPIEAPDVKIVSDSTNKRVIGEGILQTAEEENRNGRCYLRTDLEREIRAPRQIELLSTGNMLAENGHPMDPSMVRQQTIAPGNTVARFLKIWMDGDNVMGQFKGTNNALGEEFDQDLREGVKPSWSLRALGSLESIHGRNVVQNLRIITWDRVIYPSHPHAYTTRIVNESAGSIAGHKALEAMNKNGSLIPITNDAVLSYLKTESASIKSLINQIDFMYESTELINRGSQVRLIAKNGDIFVVNLEAHISNEIQNYCLSRLSK